MILARFLQETSGLPYFDLELARQILAQPRGQVVLQLGRWRRAGHVMALRRGLYTVSDALRRVPLPVPLAANEIYRPSYLSGLWALGYYGIIPERVVVVTSVTSRVTRRFTNWLGEFTYSNIRKDLFRDFSRQTIDGAPVWIASPEKALLDHWHLHPGEWSRERMAAMRFQGFELVDAPRLAKAADGYPPRVSRAAKRWMELAAQGEPA